MIRTIGDQSFCSEVLCNHGLVLVQFSAEWSGTGHLMTPTLERIDREYRGQLKVCQVDFDANPVLRKRFGIHYVPILLLFARGELVAGFSGAVSAERIIRDINENSGCVPSSPAENKREMTYEGGK